MAAKRTNLAESLVESLAVAKPGEEPRQEPKTTGRRVQFAFRLDAADRDELILMARRRETTAKSLMEEAVRKLLGSKPRATPA